MSKGSKRRPAQVDDATVARNWERTFGKDEREQPIPTTREPER